MEDPISIRLIYTIDDPLRVAKFIQDQSFVHKYDVLLSAGVVFLGFVGLILLMTDDFSRLNILGTIVFSAIPASSIGVAVYMLHGPVGSWLAKRRVTKYFDASPIINQEKTIEFSNDGIRTTGSLSSSFIRWEGIVRVTESETDFIFFTGNERFGSYIPKRAFNSPNDLTSVQKLIRQSIPDKGKSRIS
jgi:hypothetical protein